MPMIRPCILMVAVLAAVGRQRSTPPAVTPAATEVVVEVTDAARTEYQRLTAEFAQPGQRLWLRVSVVPGGCQGMRTKLDLDPHRRDADATTEWQGVPVVYEAAQYPLIQGARIDFVDRPDQRGFTVTYPHKTAANRRTTEEWGAEECREAGGPGVGR